MITYYPHSTTSDNLSGTCSGWNDIHLSELGLTQAERLRNRVKDLNFDTVYCSDLKRAVETASIAFPDHKAVSDSRLREMNYGTMNGQHKSKFGGLDMYQAGFEEGESLQDVELRIRYFLDEINQPGKQIAIVSHRFPQLALEVILNGKTWNEAFAGDWRTAGQWQPGWQYA